MSGIDQVQFENGRRASEEAFRELMVRNIGLVYSTALRRVGGDAHLAQDVAQIVFKDFALKRASLPENSAVAGWLYRHTCFTASKAVRTEARRRAREAEFASLETDNPESEPFWEQITPLLDGLMNRLNTRERNAIVLRYFAGQSLEEVANELNTSQEAARKLVSRGLTKLRTLLIKRGVCCSSGGLIAAITSAANSPIPPGLATAIASLAPAGTVVAGVSKMAVSIAFMSKIKTIAACAIVVGSLSWTLWQQFQIDHLRSLNDDLRQKVSDAGKTAAENSESLTARELSAQTEQRRKEFLELMQLRGEVAVLHDRLGERAARTPSAKDGANPPAAETARAAQSFRATGTVRVPTGQTLVTGGWLMPAGTRNFIFVKPTIQGNSGPLETVLIRASLVEMSGDAVSQAGFNQLLTDGDESRQTALYNKDQWDAQMQTLTNLEGVRFLKEQSVIAFGDGRPVKITTGGNGTNFVFSAHPQIIPEGGAVDLSYDAGLELPNAAPAQP